ncbi:MAG: integration host factor subunit beta [Clostridia bacterium]|nr:integration host factor subunit beta [Deltaproteobacteria bacterium]
MNKSELVDVIVAETKLPRKRVEDVVNVVFDEMTAALAKGGRIEIRGFGSFVAKRRDARIGRNPRTGAAIPVTEKRLPFFKAGKELRERVNAMPKDKLPP